MESEKNIPAAAAIAFGGETLDVDDLRDLMSALYDTTVRLEQTHQTLRQEVLRLQNELAQANAQLRRSRSLAALGEMAAGIAHEIRNPLASIQLYVQMLADDLAEAPQQQTLCEKIGRAVGSLDAIVRDVLAFARDMKARLTPISLHALVNRSLNQCEALLSAGDIELDINLPEKPDELHVDVNLMTQALSNVIRNAVEAMREIESLPRRLTIEASLALVRCPDGSKTRRLVLAIEDTGPGIPGEALPRIFNPFFTTRTTGTGLGLAIVHRIVDAHGGHITVAEPPAGRGARVELCLPPDPAEAPQLCPLDDTEDASAAVEQEGGRPTRQCASEAEPLPDVRIALPASGSTALAGLRAVAERKVTHEPNSRR